MTKFYEFWKLHCAGKKWAEEFELKNLYLKAFKRKKLLTIHIVIAITCANFMFIKIYHECCFQVLAIMGLEVQNEGTLVTIHKILKEYFFGSFQYFDHSIPGDMH